MKTKRCRKCGEIKCYEMFNLDKSRKDGYSYLCKICISDRSKTYYEANKEKKNEYSKAYNKANKEKISELKKAYYNLNKDKIKERHKAYRKTNKDKIKERYKARYISNKEIYLEKSSRRRALKRKAIPKFLRKCEAESQRLKDIYKLREVISLVTGIEHHVDHMWPLSDGGPHWSGNLQIITAKENLTKRDKVCKVTKKNIKDSLRIARKEYENSSNGH